MAKGQTPSVIVGHFPSITKCFSTFSTPIQVGLKTKLVKFSSAYWTFVFQALLSVTACLHGYLQKEKFDHVQAVTHLGLPKPHFNRWLPYINVTEGLVTFQSLYVFHLNQYFRFWLGIFYTSVSTSICIKNVCTFAASPWMQHRNTFTQRRNSVHLKRPWNFLIGGQGHGQQTVMVPLSSLSPSWALYLSSVICGCGCAGLCAIVWLILVSCLLCATLLSPITLLDMPLKGVVKQWI